MVDERHHNVADRPAVLGLARHRREQRRTELAEPHRSRNAFQSGPALWFNPNDFAAPSPNTYGNAARGDLYGPGQVNLDLSFVKNNVIRDRYNVQLRLDTFNLINTPYFGFPNAAIGSPAVGQITATNTDSRDLQLALKLTFWLPIHGPGISSRTLPIPAPRPPAPNWLAPAPVPSHRPPASGIWHP